jgi:hypothetical protein
MLAQDDKSKPIGGIRVHLRLTVKNKGRLFRGGLFLLRAYND